MTRQIIWCVMLIGLLWALAQKEAHAQNTNQVVFKDISNFLESVATNQTVRARLGGVVIYSYRRSSFYMQDDSAGLFVSSPTNISLDVGDLVEVTGTPTL